MRYICQMPLVGAMHIVPRYTYSKNFFKFLLVQMHFSVTYLSSKFSEFSSCVIISQKSIILSTINPQLHFKKC